MDHILEASVSKKKFKVRWIGYGAERDTWEPRNNLHPDLVLDFLVENNIYDFDWAGTRYKYCDQPFNNVRGLRMHVNMN